MRSSMAIGGDNVASGVLNSVEAFNTKTRKWAVVAPLPIPMDLTCAKVGVVGKIYAIGFNNTEFAAYSTTKNT